MKALNHILIQQVLQAVLHFLITVKIISSSIICPRYRDSAYTPASTFKIVNSLIGIQTGIITDENMVIKWDGVKRWNEDWNKDLTMKEAFAVSAVP